MSLQQLAAQHVPQRATNLLNAISAERNGAPVLALVIPENSYLTPQLLEPLYEVLAVGGKAPLLNLYLESDGGQTEVAWSVVCLLREFSDRLAALIPYRAMSGATHIALAAEELVMGPVSVLGSVDPKRSHHLLPKPDTPHSVQDLKHCIEFVERQWAPEGRKISRQEATARANQIGQIVGVLFQHVHPLAIGALEQSYELSRLITRKVLGSRADFKPDDQRIEKITEQLAGRYYSHVFFVHRGDVEKELGLPVTRPAPALWQAMRQLRSFYRSESGQQRQCQGGRLQYVGFIETAAARWVNARLHDANGKPTTEGWVQI